MAVSEKARPVDLADERYESRSLTQDALYRLFRNRAAVAAVFIIGTLVLIALTADQMVRWGWIEGYDQQHRGSSLADPLTCSVDIDRNGDGVPDPVQYCFLFGADTLGRDRLSRTVFGARVSLAVGFVGSSVSLIIGTVYGVIAGFMGGRVDNLMMRIVDFLYGIPTLPLIIIMQVYFRGLREHAEQMGGFGKMIVDLDRSMGGLFFLFIVLGMLSWIGMARLARGQVLSYKQKEFVEAARSVGASNRRIIFVHLLPNIIGPLVVVEAMGIPGYIFTEATLSFLGLGVQPPMPSWGAMVVGGVGGMMQRPYAILLPAGALSITTLAFNFLGDGLRDALDPRMRGEM